MNYYYRKITKRVRVNRCGKIGFKPFLQVIKTDNIEKFNYKKKIKFSPMPLTINRENIEFDKIYEYEVEW